MKQTIPQILEQVRAENRAAGEDAPKPNRKWRAEWVKEVGRCQNPECPWKEPEYGTVKIHVHEIAKGPHRKKAMMHREACLVLCDLCNAYDFCDYSRWPVERQLALKLVTDPEWFNLELVNELRSRAAGAITIVDLMPFLALKEAV